MYDSSGIVGTAIVGSAIVGDTGGTSATYIDLAGNIPGVSVFAGTLGISTIYNYLAGDIKGIAAFGATANRVRPFTGNITGTSAIAGAIGFTESDIMGALSGISTIAGTIKRIRNLSGSITATSSIGGYSRRIRKITGDIAATAKTVLAIFTAATIDLSGAITATSTMVGALGAIIRRTIGAGGDYANISIWKTAMHSKYASGIVSNKVIIKGEIIEATTFLHPELIFANTTNDEYYWWLTVKESIWGQPRWLTSSTNHNMTIDTNKFIIEGLIIDGGNISTGGIYSANGSAKIYARKCRIRNQVNPTLANGIYMPTGAYLEVSNCIIDNIRTTSNGPANGIQINDPTTETLLINNTIYNVRVPATYTGYAIGINSLSDSGVIVNNIVGYVGGGQYPQNMRCYGLYGLADHSYNTSDDGSTVEIIHFIQSITDELIDPANGDFRLKSTALSKNSGYNLSAYINKDIRLHSRPRGVFWDRGAYEGAIASISGNVTGQSQIIGEIYRNRRLSGNITGQSKFDLFDLSGISIRLVGDISAKSSLTLSLEDAILREILEGKSPITIEIIGRSPITTAIDKKSEVY